MELGASMKDEFMLDQSVTFVNHGSYGCTPKCIMEHRFRILKEQEAQPDKWFRFYQDNHYEDALKATAEFVKVKVENLALVDNVTTGVNTVMKNLCFKPGDKILTNNHAYNAVTKIIEEQRDVKDIEIVNVKLALPISSENELLERFRRAFAENKDIKLAVFDHISSASAIHFPVRELVSLAQEYGVITLIDGAHAPGQLELEIETLGADFYTGDFHKWCFVPRSSAFLWFSPKYEGRIRPLVTSFAYGKSLNDQFSNPGTRDFSIIASIPKALGFIRDVGGVKSIQNHAKELLHFASDLFEEIGLKIIDVPKSMRAPFMIALHFPVSEHVSKDGTWEMIKEIFLHSNVQVNMQPLDGTYYIRLSCSVYNTKEDYINAKNGIRRYLEDCQGMIF